MQSKKKSKFSMYLGWAVKRLVLVLFDFFVVNSSYFLALVVRFYVNNEFRAIAVNTYLPAFAKFAPYYTMISLIVFMLFKLYNNLWKHAGLHDLNRIFAANAVTTVVQVAGTLMFVQRMPITYYFIGSALQFLMITASRFSYRFFALENARLRVRNRAKLNVMIVGIGETARILRSQIENDSTNVARPVCIFSYNDSPSSRMINGLPVVGELSKMPEYFRKYQIKCVILADSIMPVDVRKQIRDICQKNGVEVQDFSGYLKGEGSGLTPKALLECVSGPVNLVINGKPASYENSEKALMELHGNYSVQKVCAENNRVVIELTNAAIILNDVHKDWVKDTEEETGNEISFF